METKDKALELAMVVTGLPADKIIFSDLLDGYFGLVQDLFGLQPERQIIQVVESEHDAGYYQEQMYDQLRNGG